MKCVCLKALEMRELSTGQVFPVLPFQADEDRSTSPPPSRDQNPASALGGCGLFLTIKIGGFGYDRSQRAEIFVERSVPRRHS